MEEKGEPFIKETKRGREVYVELHRLIRNYNKGQYGYGKSSPMVESYIADLSEDDFYLLMRLPIGNISRVHYTQIRNRVQKERKNVLLVYFAKDNERKINEFVTFIRKEGFNCKLTGPVNAPDCPWIFVNLYKKEFIIGKPGIDFASKRYIKHALLIDEFEIIYSIYKEINTLDDERIYELVKKYNNYSILYFNC